MSLLFPFERIGFRGLGYGAVCGIPLTLKMTEWSLVRALAELLKSCLAVHLMPSGTVAPLRTFKINKMIIVAKT